MASTLAIAFYQRHGCGNKLGALSAVDFRDVPQVSVLDAEITYDGNAPGLVPWLVQINPRIPDLYEAGPMYVSIFAVKAGAE